MKSTEVCRPLNKQNTTESRIGFTNWKAKFRLAQLRNRLPGSLAMRTYWEALEMWHQGQEYRSGDATVRLLQHTSYKKVGRLPLALML
jgi:hypothetical protein